MKVDKEKTEHNHINKKHIDNCYHVKKEGKHRYQVMKDITVCSCGRWL